MAPPTLRARPQSHGLWPILPAALARRYASSKEPVTEKSRILEKPTRFNPPSHGSRRTRSRMYPGPNLDTATKAAQATRRYPNMMPPEGTFAHWFLTNRALHLWISLSVLTSLAVYSVSLSFLQNTEFRDQLPTSRDWFRHPFQSIRQFLAVYKLHVMHESQKVSEKRRQKVEDAAKRKEFLRAHGVEPGFLTGSWMEKFGSVDAQSAREGFESPREVDKGENARYEESSLAAAQPETSSRLDTEEEMKEKRERKKVKMWFGIW